MIGLIDYDLQSSTSVKLTPPNLEIMKLSAYYRIEQNKFCRLVPLDTPVDNEYDVLYIFSESDVPVKLPPNLIAAKNVIYGGTAFTNGEYIPFENSIIDHTLPRLNIYVEYLKEQYYKGIKTRIINGLLDASYYRRHAGSEQLPIPAIRPGKPVYIYDKDFFYTGWQDIIKEIGNHRPSSIVFIHPIVCTTLNHFFLIRQDNKISRNNKIILDINIPLSDLNALFHNYTSKLLAEITKTAPIYLSLGGSFLSSFEYYKDLIYKLNLLYSFWSHNIPLKIYYCYPKKGYNDPIAELSQRITSWARGNEDNTINNLIEYKTKKADHTAKNQRDLILKFYPSAKDLFSQSQADLVKRRMWRI